MKAKLIIPSFKCIYCGEFTAIDKSKKPQICCECGKPQVNQCPVCNREIDVVEIYCDKCYGLISENQNSR